MTHQLCFPGLRPPIPTLRTPSVARRIAERIVEEVNLDEWYWAAAELSFGKCDTFSRRTVSARVHDIIADVTEEIVAHGKPATVFSRLNLEPEPAVCVWDGIDDHCRHIADDIAREEVDRAVDEHGRHYGDRP